MQDNFEYVIDLVLLALCFYAMHCVSKKKVKRALNILTGLLFVFSLKVTNNYSLYQALTSIHSYDDFRNTCLSAVFLTAIFAVPLFYLAGLSDRFFDGPTKK